MGIISNNFLTIKYNNESQEKMAKYYMFIINLEPDFFKTLLNGLDTIKGYELRKFKIDDNNYFKNFEKNRLSVINSILKLRNARNPYFEVSQVSESSLYYDILAFKNLRDQRPNTIQIEYFDLAHDYYYMTGDTKYIKNYLYDGISLNELDELCNYKILNCLPELLKTKMYEDKYSYARNIYKSLANNLRYISSIIPVVTEWSNKELSSISEENKKDTRCKNAPAITKKEFEKLVIGALNYVDPTNSLVEEYISLNAEDKISIKPLINDETSNYNRVTGTIELYARNTITDVIVFLHEFAHYIYNEVDDDTFYNNIILSEYPSIYYEMKAVEYLKQQGYTEEELINARKFRAITNNYGALAVFPCIEYLNIVNSRDRITAVEDVVEYINHTVEERINKLPRNKKNINLEEIKKQLKIEVSCIFLEPSSDAMKHIKYLIGTFLADMSIRCAKHEDVLTVLECIKNRKVSLEEVNNMLAGNSINKSNPQKIKN